MKNILISSTLLLAIILIIGCAPDEPTPKLGCESIYPVYESIIANYEPTFEWCADETIDSFRFQLSEVEDFSSLLFDSFTEINSITPLYWRPTSPSTFVNQTLEWGKTHYWRVAKVKDDLQEEWNDTYIFETNDIRDDIVGVYEAEKRRFWLDHNENIIYYDSIYSINQIEVEKIESTQGIRVKDNTSGDFNVDMDINVYDYWWKEEGHIKPSSKFKINTDSFEVKIIDCTLPPCTGYRYSGRE